MHSLDGSFGTTFHFNSDLSGDVRIIPHNWRGKETPETHIPGRDILDLVAHYVTNERISKLKQADTAEILGVDVPEKDERECMITGSTRRPENEQRNGEEEETSS